MNDSERAFASLPRGLTPTEISRRLGVDYHAALRLISRRRYRASDGRKFSQNHKRRLLPEQVDWTRSNADIAREFAVSRERVRVMRNRLRKKFVESRGRKPASV